MLLVIGDTMETEEDFAYRQNGDGSFDSICLHCYRTVMTANNIDDLAEHNRRHQCRNIDLSKSNRLNRLKIVTRTSSQTSDGG